MRYGDRHRRKRQTTAWAVWRVHPKITESFNDLSDNTDTNGADNAAVIERCSVLLFDRTSKVGNINGVRNELFKRKGTFAHENLPPIKRSTTRRGGVYQCGHAWGQSMCPQMRLLKREDWC